MATELTLLFSFPGTLKNVISKQCKPRMRTMSTQSHSDCFTGLKRILCNIFTQISQVYEIDSWNSCIWIALNINVIKLNVCQDRKWLAYCEDFYFSFSRYPVASDKKRISRNISRLTSWEIIEFKILARLLDLYWSKVNEIFLGASLESHWVGT